MKKLLIIITLITTLCATSYPQTTTPDTTQTTNPSLLTRIENWYSDNMNYTSITALMAIESSFIPFPSEIVIPPAVYVAHNPDCDLHLTNSYLINILLIILFGTLGALIGATINYFLSLWIGRPLIYKFADSKIGHLCLLNSAKLQKAENYFNQHGRISTFIGRLIPAIRQLISIPAGLARMNFGIFIAYTALGAFVWNCVLALLGYIAHGQADLIERYNHELSIAIVVIVAIVIAYLIIKHTIRHLKNKPQ